MHTHHEHVTHSRRRPDIEDHFRAHYRATTEVWQDDQDRDEFLVEGQIGLLLHGIATEFPHQWMVLECDSVQLVLHRPRAFLVPRIEA